MDLMDLMDSSLTKTISHGIEDTSLKNWDIIKNMFNTLYHNHSLIPLILFFAYFIVACKLKFKVKNWIFDIVELFAFGHAFGLAAEMFLSTFRSGGNGGGLLGGAILGGISIIGIYKILITNQNIIIRPIPKFKVISALFGIDGNEKDVTNIVNSRISDGKLNIMVHIDIFGDHIRNTPKRLNLNYEIDGKSYNRSFREEEVIQLP